MADSRAAERGEPTEPARAAPLPPVTGLLPPAQAEFLVVADTHLVDPRAAHTAEFGSRLRQNARVAAALRVAEGTGLPVVHLGDLVQDYPRSPLHESLLTRAVGQWRATGLPVCFAPGNTDIGDQRDPSSPAELVSVASMERFSGITGAPWTATDIGPVRAIVLAASLFNSQLDLEAQQWRWLESELGSAAGHRVALFFHYPLFLRSPGDPDIGNYDVVNEPARSRLIDLVTRYGVEAVFTGHSHFHFVNRIGATRAYGVPSTSFTRPGFSELFSSAPPADQGRDDVPKLGLLLARVHENDIRVHLVRTASLAEAPDTAVARPVVTGTPRDVPSSRLGVVLRHPVATFADVPETFPSVVRQPVRNDYPLLACLELGARHVSVAMADARDPALAERLCLLREEGVRVTARVIWAAGHLPELPPPNAPVDEIELMLLDRSLPDPAELGVLDAAAARRPVVISALRRQFRRGAELPRWRYGLAVAEVAALDRCLDGAGRTGSRVLVAAGDVDDVLAAGEFVAGTGLAAIAAVDLVAPVGGPGTASAARLAEMFLVASGQPTDRFIVDGLSELDRTLDLSAGLLDRSWNPRPTFHTLRVLNSVLYGGAAGTVTRREDGFRIPRPGGDAVVLLAASAAGPPADSDADLIDLTRGVATTADAVVAGEGCVLWLPREDAVPREGTAITAGSGPQKV